VAVTETTSAGVTVPLLFPLAAPEEVQATAGSTIRNIVGEHHTVTELLLTDSGAPRAEIRWQNAKPARVNKWVAKAAISPATALEETALAIGLEGEALATGREEQVSATATEAEQIALEAEIFRAVAAETVTPSGEVPGGSTDRMLVPAVAAARPAWGAEVSVAVEAEVSVVAVVVGGEDRNENRWSTR